MNEPILCSLSDEYDPFRAYSTRLQSFYLYFVKIVVDKWKVVEEMAKARLKTIRMELASVGQATNCVDKHSEEYLGMCSSTL